MAAMPRPLSHPEPEPVPGNLAGDCRAYAAGDPVDPTSLLNSLDALQAALTDWRCAAILAHARNPQRAAPPHPSVGEVVRRCAAWLEAHPERTNEPPVWMLDAVLADLVPAQSASPTSARR